jgi:hypothetical protein
MYYIYKTTNLVNNKIYVGLHKSDDIENDLYMGSGTAFSKAFKKYGRDNFKREILYSINTLEEASKLESLIVNEDFVRDRNNYNLKTGGVNGWMLEPHNIGKIAITSPISGKVYYTEEHELQLFLEKGYVKGQHINGRNCIFKDGSIKYVTDDKINEFIDNGWIRWNTTKGKICLTHLEEMKLIYVESEHVEYYKSNGYIEGNLLAGINKDRVAITFNGKNKMVKKCELHQYLEEGWSLGRTVKELKIKRMFNPITNELKNVPLNEIDKFIEEGWKLGVNYKGVGGRIYITKDTKNKRIDPRELEKFIQLGWKKGMYNKKYNNE